MRRGVVIGTCIILAACERNEPRDLAERRAQVTLAGVASSDQPGFQPYSPPGFC